MLTLTLTPNRDPGPMPGMSLIRYVRSGDHVHAEFHRWETDDTGRTFKARVRIMPVNHVRHEHAGPTIRITSRLQLIADGVLKPSDKPRWRKSLKALQETHVRPADSEDTQRAA